MAYRFDSKQRTLAIGVYPKLGLRDAREARDAARRTLAAGQDPAVAKKLAKAAQAVAGSTTFDAVAAELLEKKRREAKAERTMRKVEWQLSLASPTIGKRPIAEIAASEVLVVVRGVEARGRHETARRLRAIIKCSVLPSPRAARPAIRPPRSKAHSFGPGV
jgi:hypothetical protein